MVVDLDEFVYARNGFHTIKEYLASLPSTVSQVHVPWKMFGSNGYNTLELKQPIGVIQHFTRRVNYDMKDSLDLVKCIVRTQALQAFNIHSSNFEGGESISSSSPSTELYSGAFTKVTEEILQSSCLHLNHYAIQSLEWFMRIKATRGSADRINNPRNEQYHKEYDKDSNQLLDEELKYHSSFNLSL
jgi:hypothetical protein